MNEDIRNLIEFICCNSDSEGTEIDIIRGRKVSTREKRLSEALTAIYKIVHPHKKCRHPDWAEETKKMILELKKQGEIK